MASCDKSFSISNFILSLWKWCFFFSWDNWGQLLWSQGLPEAGIASESSCRGQRGFSEEKIRHLGIVAIWSTWNQSKVSYLPSEGSFLKCPRIYLPKWASYQKNCWINRWTQGKWITSDNKFNQKSLSLDNSEEK